MGLHRKKEMELVVKQYVKYGEIDKIEIHNNTLGEIYTVHSKEGAYEIIENLGLRYTVSMKVESYYFDDKMLNDYVKIW